MTQTNVSIFGSGASPPRQLSTVRPMLAGHAISRPRIQLERVDLSSMTEQQPGPKLALCFNQEEEAEVERSAEVVLHHVRSGQHCRNFKHGRQ